MPAETIVLDSDEATWGVLDKLLGTLKKTVVERFPEEAINASRLELARDETQSAQNRVELEQVAYKAVAALEGKQQEYAKADQLVADYTAEEREAVFVFEQRKEKYVQAMLALDQGHGSQTDVNNAKTLRDDQEADLQVIRRKLNQAQQDRHNQGQQVTQAQREAAAKIKHSSDANVAETHPVALESLVAVQSVKAKLATAVDNRKKLYQQALAQEQTFLTEQKTLKKKYEGSRKNLAKAIEKVESARNQDYMELSNALGELADKVPRDVYRQTVVDFKIASDSARHQAELTKVKAELAKTINQKLANPSDKSSASIAFDIGAAFSLLGGAAKVKGVFTLTLEVSAQRDQENRYVASSQKGGKFTFSAEAGTGAADALNAKVTGQGSANVDKTQARIYTAEDDFIQQEANTFMAAILAGRGDKEKRNFVTESAKLLADASAAHDQLERNLHMLGGLTKDQKLTRPEQKQINHIAVSTTAVGGDASLSAELKAGEYGGGVALGDGILGSKQTMYKQIAYLDDIQNQPALQKIYAKKAPKNFGFYLFGDDGADPKYLTEQDAINKLDDIEKHITRLKSGLNNAAQTKQLAIADYRRQLASSLGMLRQEYNAYVQLANYIDHGYTSSEVKKRMQEFNERRGVSNNAEYVKAMSLQFARLRGLYESCFDSADDIPTDNAEFNEGFADNLKIPRMLIKKTDKQAAFNLKAQTEDITVTRSAGFFEIGSVNQWDESTNKTKATGKFKVALEHEIKQAPNFPIQNEETIKLKFNLDLGVKGDNYVVNLFKSDKIDKLFGGSALDVRAETADLARNMTNGSVEFNYVKRGGHWVVKNAKGFSENDKTIGGQISVGADIQAVVGTRLKTASKQVKNIYFGTHTLRAMPDVFRAKHYYTKNAATQEEQDATWDDFRKKTDVIGRMADRLIAEKKVERDDADKDTKVKIRMLNDLNQWLGDLDADEENPASQEAANKFRTAFQDGKASRNDVEAALSELIRAKTARDDRVIAKAFTKRRALKGQDINAYAAQKLADTLENINNRYYKELDITQDQPIDDVDQLVTKAKARYAKNKTPDDYDLLKRAYALQYAAKHLDALTSGGDDKDTNEAIDLLSSGIDNVLASDKVYIDKRVEARLSRNQATGDLDIQPVVRKGHSKVIKQSSITKLVNDKFFGLTHKQQAIQMEDATGNTKAWHSDAYSADAEKNYQRRTKKSLRSMRTLTRRRLFGGKKGNIADAIETVMQDRFKKRQQKKQADQNRRKSSVNQI